MTTEKKADITKRELTETLREIATDGKTGALERLAAAVMLADVEGLYYAKVERLIKVIEAVGGQSRDSR